MKLITLAQARDHVKADGDDDAQLIIYCNAAEAWAARLANRNLYATTAELSAAVAGVSASLTAAYAAYDAAITAAEASDDDRIEHMMTMQAQNALDKATVQIDRIINGIALDAMATEGSQPSGDDVIGAILLIVGHLYTTRASVVSGQGAAAVEVPMGAREILTQLRWNGPYDV